MFRLPHRPLAPCIDSVIRSIHRPSGATDNKRCRASDRAQDQLGVHLRGQVEDVDRVRDEYRPEGGVAEHDGGLHAEEVPEGYRGGVCRKRQRR